MNRLTLLYLVILIFTISACKREFIEIPEDQEGEPVFSTSFALDGNTHQYTAGLDAYFMHTSFTENTDQVLTYIGNFADENCSQGTCNSSLQFEIRSTQLAPETSIENDLMPMGYAFWDINAPVADVYQVKLDGFYEEDNLKEFFWDFDDGSSPVYNSLSTIHNYTDNTGETLFPRFNVVSNAGHRTSHSKQLYFDESSFCTADFEVIENNDGTIQLQGVGNGASDPNLYWWTYGWGTELEATITPNLDSLFLLDYNLQIFYADGCYSEISTTFSEDSTGHLAYAKSDYNTEVLAKIAGGSQLGLSTFAIQYTDENGKIFRSDRKEQTDDSYFRITSVEDYLDNASGQSTKKLQVAYHCWVTATDGESLQIAEGEGTIAVAYPN